MPKKWGVKDDRKAVPAREAEIAIEESSATVSGGVGTGKGSPYLD
jgi:hypothetical protein